MGKTSLQTLVLATCVLAVLLVLVLKYGHRYVGRRETDFVLKTDTTVYIPEQHQGLAVNEPPPSIAMRKPRPDVALNSVPFFIRDRFGRGRDLCRMWDDEAPDRPATVWWQYGCLMEKIMFMIPSCLGIADYFRKESTMNLLRGIIFVVTLATIAMMFLGLPIHKVCPSLQSAAGVDTGNLEVEHVERIERRLYMERRQHAQSKCYIRGTEKVAQIHLHADSELAYCPVPKIGCTFWKRIFLFLHNTTGTPVSSPLEIPRLFVHNGKAKGAATPLDWTPEIEANISRTYTRFLFGRNPYTRLWSAYLDKFVLPRFWRSVAKGIIDRRANATERAKTCRDDISFVEFLNFVLSGSASNANDHWRPVKFLCDPCLFKPDIIGKQESFTDDAKYILKDTEVGWLMDTFDRDIYVMEELKMLTDYNFKLISGGMFPKCIDDTGIAELLWRVFQINGYLPQNVDFSTVNKNLGNKITQTNFKEYAMRMYDSASNYERKKWQLQKKASLVSAYSEVPESLIKSLIVYYQDDFEMFGYNTHPPV